MSHVRLLLLKWYFNGFWIWEWGEGRGFCEMFADVMIYLHLILIFLVNFAQSWLAYRWWLAFFIWYYCESGNVIPHIYSMRNIWKSYNYFICVISMLWMSSPEMRRVKGVVHHWKNVSDIIQMCPASECHVCCKLIDSTFTFKLSSVPPKKIREK